MTELMLLRHGETKMTGVYCGRSDPPLTKQGQRCARKAARAVSEFSPQHVYTSDLLRAMQTAALAAPGLRPVVLPSLREMDFGDFEGLDANEAANRMPEQWQAYMDDFMQFRFPNGDAVASFLRRSAQAVSNIASAHKGERVLIVTHKGVVMAALSHFLHKEPSHALHYDVRTGGWARLTISDGFAVLKALV